MLKSRIAIAPEPCTVNAADLREATKNRSRTY